MNTGSSIRANSQTSFPVRIHLPDSGGGKLFRLAALAALLFTWPVPAAEPGHDFGKWEKAIASFEKMDAANPPPKNALLFVGSSGIRLWKTLAEDFPGHQVINRGFGGSQIVDSTHFADRIIFPYEPKMIFFRAGGNDLAAGKSPEQVFADFKEFLDVVHAKMPGIDVAYIALNPSIVRWSQSDKEKALNAMVGELSKQVPHLKYIETFSMVLGPDGKPRPELFVADKLHFNEEGYKLLKDRVRPFIPE